MPHRSNPSTSLRPLAMYPAPSPVTSQQASDSQPRMGGVEMKNVHMHLHSVPMRRRRGQEEYWARVGGKEEGMVVHVGSHPHAHTVLVHDDVHEAGQTLVSVVDGSTVLHTFPFSFSQEDMLALSNYASSSSSRSYRSTSVLSSSTFSSESSSSYSRSTSVTNSSSSSFSSSSQRSRGTDTSISCSLRSTDLQAALVAEPDNPEAKALLHQRSVAVEKLLAPLPKLKDRLSPEIWREIALFLPRRDLKSLLFVPHAVSRVASQLLFRELDLHFSAVEGEEEENASNAMVCDGPSGLSGGVPTKDDQAARHAQRSADILTRIITDPGFAIAVKTLRIYAASRERDAGMAFQTGMLTNALPKLVNLRNVHISSGAESVVSVLKILQSSSPRLKGLSINSPDGPADMSFLDLGHLSHFSYSTMSNSSTVPAQISAFLAQNRTSLRTVCLENPHPSPHWTFPSSALSVRNLTSLHFAGSFPGASYAFTEIITNGRQLEDLTLQCSMLECTGPSAASQQFRAMLHSGTLPFLRNFSFSVSQIGRRTMDRDLFPAVAEFLRGRTQLRTLKLVAFEEGVQRAVGFDASVWGVLPTLTGLKGLTITYPNDLAPGLAAWLIPRSVVALTLTLDYVNGVGRDPGAFFAQLRNGVPPELKYIGLSDLPLRNVSSIIEHGFPMVRVLRIGGSYWTVNNIKAPHTSPHLDSSHTHHSVHTHHHRPPQPVGRELEPWPRRRVLYHAQEWLEWLGCEDAMTRDPTSFPASAY
ncbi:hypothetical protein BDQ17DRAFT_1432957 [Cyathus striatus]|nr:hypothetical protein BDQ17DRAFT_1432957 [Cyathus striatus]